MIRELTGHRVNGANEAIRIFVLDEPGPGGACHDYLVLIPGNHVDPHTYKPGLEEAQDAAALGTLKYTESHNLPNNCVLQLYNQPIARITDLAGNSVYYVTQRIKFQHGPIKEVGVNGNTHEVLLTILVDRLEGFQSGDFKNRDNAVALTHIETAKLWLHKRTMDRLSRGVEGTNQQ